MDGWSGTPPWSRTEWKVSSLVTTAECTELRQNWREKLPLSSSSLFTSIKLSECVIKCRTPTSHHNIIVSASHHHVSLVNRAFLESSNNMMKVTFHFVSISPIVEYFSYDHRWRVLTKWRRTHARSKISLSLTSNDQRVAVGKYNSINQCFMWFGQSASMLSFFSSACFWFQRFSHFIIASSTIS